MHFFKRVYNSYKAEEVIAWARWIMWLPAFLILMRRPKNHGPGRIEEKDMEAENRQRQKAFDQELESKTKETLEELSQRLEERSGRQLEKLKEENGRSLEALEKTFAGSRQMLADELFQKLIEVS